MKSILLTASLIGTTCFASPLAAADESSERHVSSLTERDLEEMVDQGYILLCTAAKEPSCTDQDLERESIDDLRGRLSTHAAIYLLGNQNSGNVWAIHVSLNNSMSTARISSVALPQRAYSDWLEFLGYSQSEN